MKTRFRCSKPGCTFSSPTRQGMSAHMRKIDHLQWFNELPDADPAQDSIDQKVVSAVQEMSYCGLVPAKAATLTKTAAVAKSSVLKTGLTKVREQGVRRPTRRRGGATSRNRYTVAFKVALINMTLAGERTGEVAAKFGINADMLSRWKKESKFDGCALFTVLALSCSLAHLKS